MKSSVRARVEEDKLFMIMDGEIDKLRKEIWKIIFKIKGKMPDCDVAMTLGLVQYELIHHTKQ